MHISMVQILKEWRMSKGYTQTECAKLVGVHQASWSALELGTKPNIETALAIAELTQGAVPVTAWAKARKRGKR